MLKRYLSLLAKFCALFLGLIVIALPQFAAADDVDSTQNAAITLQLDVSINGQPTGLVAAFTDLGDSRLAATARELGEIGIVAPAGKAPNDLVPLSDLPGLSYVYDEPAQAIAIETGDNNRIKKTYDARGELKQATVTPSDYGAVLNYTLFGSHGGEDGVTSFRTSNFDGINATLDTRLIAPFGVLDNSAIIGMTLADETETLRLDTTYTFSDEDDLVRWRAGDFISGGTAWSRPVRLGGVQVQRAFSMQPNLVKSPLPAVSGSAAVPTAVDVYINGVKSFSKDVAAGPYQIDNIPAVTGAGVAQVVTRDASGRETVQSVSFYNSPQLLKPGLLDFSMETGFSRAFYGIESNAYSDDIVASGTLRAGINDWLTGEVHGEVGEKLLNGGAGVVARVFDRAVVSAALSGSSSDEGSGAQLYGSFETKVGPVSINGRSQHALGDYEDIASLTARENPIRPDFVGIPGISTGLFSYAPPRAIDSVTLSTPLTFDKATVSATYLRYEADDDDPTEIVTATYSRPILERASLLATGYVDLNESNNSGFYLGVSMSLDGNVSVSSGLSGRGGDYGAQISANKPVEQKPGSWGWRVTDLEDDNPYRTASVGYRTSAARLEAGLTQGASGVRASATVEGALSMIGGDVYASNRIDDAFAVVDVHEPNVKVERENVVVGTTNENGKIMIPNLNSYQRNKISIDPMDLPINAEPATTYDYITPSFKSGVYVDFDVKKATQSALVVLQDGNGAFIPPGSEGQLEGSDEPFVVGYDGQAFIKDLKSVNTVRITHEKGTCTAQFAFAPTNEIQPVIGPEVCQ